MRQEFDQLLQSHQEHLTSDTTQPLPSELTPGQMLFMCFSGLFTQLSGEFDNMLDAVGQIQTPETWKMIDVVKEAQSIKVIDRKTDSERSMERDGEELLQVLKAQKF